MTTTSDARKRLAEAERVAHPAVTIPGAVSDAAVEAAARRMWRGRNGSISSHDSERTRESDKREIDESGYGSWDRGSVAECVKDVYRRRASNALTAALPRLRKDWEAPLRELLNSLDRKAVDLNNGCRNCRRPVRPIERKQIVFHPTMPAFTEWDHDEMGHWCDGSSGRHAAPITDETLDEIRADLAALLAPEVPE